MLKKITVLVEYEVYTKDDQELNVNQVEIGWLTPTNRSISKIESVEEPYLPVSKIEAEYHTEQGIVFVGDDYDPEDDPVSEWSKWDIRENGFIEHYGYYYPARRYGTLCE